MGAKVFTMFGATTIPGAVGAFPTAVGTTLGAPVVETFASPAYGASVIGGGAVMGAPLVGGAVMGAPIVETFAAAPMAAAQVQTVEKVVEVPQLIEGRPCAAGGHPGGCPP